MKKHHFLIPLLVVTLLGCKKERTPKYQAKASFSVSALYLGTRYPDDTIKVGTHDELSFTNESTYADAVQWDFGDQHTSTAPDATYAYDRPGNYTVTLTVVGKNGTQSTYSRQIQVLERVVKKLTLTGVYLNRFAPFYNGTHTFSKADLWIEIKYDQTMAPFHPDGSSAAPVIYQSPLFSNIDSSFHGTLTYSLAPTPAVVIDYPVRNTTYPIFPSTGRGTILELHGKDDSGSYLLGTSWGTGLHLLSGGGNPATDRSFDLGFSVPDGVLANQIKLDCTYQ